MKRIVFIVYTASFFVYAQDPIEGLRAISQSIRTETAKKLRNEFVAPSSDTWKPLIEKVKVGVTKSKALEILSLHEKDSQMGICSGSICSEAYRLDSTHILRLWFRPSDSTVTKVEMDNLMQHIWVEAPEKFTGTWVVYFVNGQKSHEIQYLLGKYHGTFTSYHSNGEKSVVQLYVNGVVDGKSVGYFKSGKVAYRASYKMGQESGTWFWYDENGSIINTKKH